MRFSRLVKILSDVIEEFCIQRVERQPGRRATVHFDEDKRHVPQLFVRGDQIVLVELQP